jgi:hypothetical protein
MPFSNRRGFDFSLALYKRDFVEIKIIGCEDFGV